jgi:mRNA interferase RelE/StbE
VSWEIRWADRAADDLRRLARRDPRTAQRIGQTVTRFAETGQGDLTKLSGGTDEWRLRVGAWRVRFRFENEAHAIVVTRVLDRKEAYRD